MTVTKYALAGLLTLALAAGLRAQPKPAQPLKEHEWLHQFVGEWDADIGKGTQNGRMVGGLWLVSDAKATLGDQAFAAMLTLGYDPEKKKYVGTWVDSMIPYLWKYEGTVDATGKVLTLDTEGPNPALPGKMFKMRDVFEFKGKDHYVLTSSMQGDDGKWQTFLTVNYRRKK